MKKRVLGVVLLVIIAMIAGACSPEGMAFLEENDKVMEWDYITSEVEGNIHMEVPGEEGTEKIDVAFTGEGVTDNSDKTHQKALANITFDGSEDFPLDELELLIDGEKAYFSKNYFESIFDSTGLEFEILQDENITHVLIDTSDTMGMEIYGDDEEIANMTKNFETYMAPFMDPAREDEAMDMVISVLEDLNIEFDVEQDGRNFRFEITGDDLIDQTKDTVKGFSENFESIIDTLNIQEAFELTDEDIAEAKAELAELQSEETMNSIEMARPFLKGLHVKADYEYQDEEYLTNVAFNLPIENLFTFNMDMSQVAKKSDVKPEINFPADDACITFNELMEAMEDMMSGLEGTAIISENDAQFIGAEGVAPLVMVEKDGENLYGFRQIFEGLEYEVFFDAETKQPCFTVDDKDQCFDLFIQDGVSYISVEELTEIDGIDVIEDEANGMVIINLAIEEPVAK